MPSINDKLKLEAHNERTIRLWPEGKFLKAYERSAYLFITHVRAYEATRKYVGVVGGDVVSIGFPESVLGALGMPYEKDGTGVVLLHVSVGIDEQQYFLWRDTLPLVNNGTRVSHPREQQAELPVMCAEPQVGHLRSDAEPQVGHLRTSVEALVVGRLRDFSLATATPLECMMLVSELQKMISEKD